MSGIKGSVIDEVGNVYGDRTVVSRASNNDQGSARWLVRCKCGREDVVFIRNLKGGKAQCCKNCAGRIDDHLLGMRDYYRSYRAASKSKGRVFALSFEEFKTIAESDCNYCGAEPRERTTANRSKNRQVTHLINGVDRIDSSVGYVRSNCVPCCTTCNIAKHNLTLYEFVQWIERVHSHLKGTIDG